MSVTNQNSKSKYTANGTSTVFAYDFRILDSSHAVVYITDLSGVDTLQVEGSDYTIDGVGDNDGGNITFTSPPTLSYTVTIYRSIPINQLVDYIPTGRFPAETHEEAIDKLTLLCQDISKNVERSLRISELDSVDTFDPMDLATRLSSILGFDSNGNIDLSVNIDDVRAVILANKSSSIPTTSDYGLITSTVLESSDYGDLT